MKKVLIIILMLINIYIINKPIEYNLKSIKNKSLNSKCLKKIDEIFDYLKNKSLINYFIKEIKDEKEQNELICKVKVIENNIQEIREFWQKNLDLLFLFRDQINILLGYYNYKFYLNLQNFNNLFNINSEIDFSLLENILKKNSKFYLIYKK